jgi:hypothetical protein
MAGLLALPLAACDTDKLVEVEDPARLRPEEFDNPAAIPQLVAGVRQRFTGGYSGFGLDDAFLSSSALISDEFYVGDSFLTRLAADQRVLQAPVLGNISDAAFLRLNQARLNARRTFATIARFSTPATAATDSTNQAFVRTIEGYVYTTISEGWCSGAPFSDFPESGTVDPTQVQGRAGISTAQMNDSAVVRFNEAIALTRNGGLSVNGAHLARVGRARSLLNNGRFAEAAAAVQAVPTNFVFYIEHSLNASSQYNPITSLNGNGRYGVSNLEGAQTATGAARNPATAGDTATTALSAEGVAFRGLRDPRVPWASVGACFSANTCFANQNYYPDFGADVPLASGVEARLIEAEALLRTRPDSTLAILNNLRSQVASLVRILYPQQTQTFPAPTAGAPSLPALTAAQFGATFEAQRATFFRERALWLYNTGHRQGDLRRLVRQYGLTTSQAFPSGPWFRGGSYGDDVAYPVPFAEETNNPNFVRSQCVTTQA